MPEQSVAPRDALTRLPTRDAFHAALSRSTGAPRAVALVEIGRLVRLNDAAGEAAGDELLKAVGRRLSRLIRAEFGPRASVYRIGGARFAIVPPASVGLARLRVEARAIVQAVGELLPEPTDAQQPLLLRLALGPVGAPDSGADVARIAQRLSSRSGDLRAIDMDAVLRGEGLELRLQPQFAIEGDQLIGAEALASMQHPRLGEIGGAALFAAAARAGLERELSHRVWRTAIETMARWDAPLDTLRVSLNLTAADLCAPDLVESLLTLASDAGVAPQRLGVEVVETAALGSMNAARCGLIRLRQAGVHVALDDFGTAHSGFAWLRQLPVDSIKIDSDFAADADTAERDRTVLQGVLDLAQTLGVKVLVEGIESEEQLARIAAMGADAYQGYLRAEPLAPERFAEFARGWMIV